jgi:hypothetical protein
MIEKYSPETIEFLSVMGFVACVAFAAMLIGLALVWAFSRMESKSAKESAERRFREDALYSLRDLNCKLDAIARALPKPVKPTRTMKKGK